MWAAVTGLRAEARLLERRGISVVATAGDPQRTRAACERLLAGGADGLVSFGIAGALAPGLLPGALLLPRRVIDRAGAVFAVDRAWHGRVLAALRPPVEERDLLGRAALVTAAAEKAALHRQSGAAAVDLESVAAAQVAAEAARPFLVLRAVADPASWSLPPAAAVGLDAAGRTAVWPVLRSLAAHPGQAMMLAALGFATRRALQALARAADAL